MTDKLYDVSFKKDMSNKNNNDFAILTGKKLDFFKDIIQKTIIHVQKNKTFDILGINEVNICIERLSELSKKIRDLSESMNLQINKDEFINNLQLINNDFSSLFKSYGTDSLEDLLLICFGVNNKIIINEKEIFKFELLKKYFHPTSYKVFTKKDEIIKNKTNNESSDEKLNNLDCQDVLNNFKQFHMKVYGLKLFIHSDILKKSLMINGYIDDVIIDLLNNKYISVKQKDIKDNLPEENEFKGESFAKYISSLTLKDYLIHNTHLDIYNKYAGYLSQHNNLKQKQMSVIVKEFITDDIYSKRNTLIQLLINSDNYENQYLAYLLYDLLSNDSNGTIDTQEQTILFDSFPWSIKQCFKQAMKKTVQYTNELSNFDINKIPLEQQICLLKASDNVKEKAMMKLKEVKSKSEDSGSKARQYLDGLLKIPFNIYKKEPILHTMDIIRNSFKDMYIKYKFDKIFPSIPLKEKYTIIEILKYIKIITNSSETEDSSEIINKIMNYLVVGDKKKIYTNINIINELLKKYNYNNKIKYNTLNKSQLKTEIENYIDFCKNPENKSLMQETIEQFKLFCNVKDVKQVKNLSEVNTQIVTINKNIKQINDYMKYVTTTLNQSVYGHDKAKRQIERIIGQWINGEQKGTACGFEGPPGVGKTSLAKGLANCLKDEAGNSRPFSFIAIGGDSNSSSLVGHSYTYVGSTWGQILQILMDKKCMNPVILIDEVDKVSKTEHGKEIIGILTHLLDPTQNDCFQDKYFSGIDLDLSKVLFILSYNDVTLIDRIMLDRINRIKFDNLSLEDKIVICNKHLLPEIYKNVGLENMLYFSNETLKFIIQEYTLEAGVRKLKEILFEIIGEVNLEILNNENNYITNDIPIEITIESIKNTYFKDKREAKIYKIHTESKVGLINALWANEMKQGGVLPLQISFVPSSKFLDLTLTGSLGDVMKQSISVSLTNAWNLTKPEKQEELILKYNNTKYNQVYGIHVHCPSISTPKDGPSATTAFTVAIYSLLNNVKIKYYFGITGETSFDYCLTEIGGLQEKIIHSIPAGIKEFIFPVENKRDFDKIMKKYNNYDIIKGIKFHAIDKIEDVLELILEKE